MCWIFSNAERLTEKVDEAEDSNDSDFSLADEQVQAEEDEIENEEEEAEEVRYNE